MGTADWRRYVDGESTAETSRWLQKKKKKWPEFEGRSEK